MDTTALELRAAALEAEARDLRTRAQRVNKLLEYVRKSVRTSGETQLKEIRATLEAALSTLLPSQTPKLLQLQSSKQGVLRDALVVVDLAVFSRNLWASRRARGMSQRELATLLGVSCMAVSNYETGKRLPNKVIMQAIADVFNISIEELTTRRAT